MRDSLAWTFLFLVFATPAAADRNFKQRFRLAAGLELISPE